MNIDNSVVFEIQALHFGLSVDYKGYSISSKGFLPIVVGKWSSELNWPIPVHFSSLIPKTSMFHSCYLLFDHFQFTLIHGPNIPGSYAIFFFTASDFISITSHIHNCVLFSLWLSLFILSGAIFPLFSSSTLGTYHPGEFIFQCPFCLFMGFSRQE